MLSSKEEAGCRALQMQSQGWIMSRCPRHRRRFSPFKSALSLCGAHGDEKAHWLRFGRTGPSWRGVHWLITAGP